MLVYSTDRSRKRFHRLSWLLPLLIGSSANAAIIIDNTVSGAMVITEINQTVNAVDDPFEVAVPGGSIFINVGLSAANGDAEYANATGTGSVVFSLVPPPGPTSVVAPSIAASFLNKFEPGDIVDGMDFLTNSNFGNFYDPFGGEWASVGETGFLGWRSGGAGAYTYGWLEATRGSLILGDLGYNSTVNAGAPIPAPAPATIALIGLGLAGIGYQRRKRFMA